MIIISFYKFLLQILYDENLIIYKLFFQLENNTINALGLIGNASSSSDCIILEEYTTLNSI
jgi:hypothetical protein